jgi:hypothetical protein
MTSDLNSPVAILDKEIAKYPTYTIETFELCDCCGARFGIAYHQECKHHADSAAPSDEAPRALREMLAKDHNHDRQHKHFTEIWIMPTWESSSSAAMGRSRA